MHRVLLLQAVAVQVVIEIVLLVKQLVVGVLLKVVLRLEYQAIPLLLAVEVLVQTIVLLQQVLTAQTQFLAQ